ncbi:DivIVA domain-containing protein [Candidatus Oleimmundimicrobium sp.]|uniref:DivIVA domain-containing protein n=1 Tax=Candidatus Oleimmundimicrobium sp. TaxID=3060597 RepID=UPI00271D042A|nr:DivIVA domain-containing protein [Candidatus Oleimmundimicrobium sp.]MDO8885519.1 DivIVA domain-containing protein [Candidatus Oleimmundimicrobium sp.]
MRLTPLDIHNKEFRRAIRGYNEEDVDVFLDKIAEELELLYKENNDMKEELEKINEKIKQYENIEQTLQNTLLTAQKSAEEVQANSKKEAELVIKDAVLKAREIIQDAVNEKRESETNLKILKQAEEEFRMRFKSVLESYLNVLNETEGIEEIEKKVKELEEFKKENLVEESSELATEEFAEENDELLDQPSEEKVVINEEPEEAFESLTKKEGEEDKIEEETQKTEADEEAEEETQKEAEEESKTKKKSSKKTEDEDESNEIKTVEIPSFLKEGPREDFLNNKNNDIEEIS